MEPKPVYDTQDEITPGQWEDREIQAPLSNYAYPVYSRTGNGPTRPVGIFQHAKDARLSAAAPEMLAAIEALLQGDTEAARKKALYAYHKGTGLATYDSPA